MLKLEARPQPSSAWSYGSPMLALGITVIIGIIMFLALGKDPMRGLEMFFWQPIRSGYAVGELLVKATPLLIIALGLAVCFRSNVWNIGAEGQYIIGAIFAGGVALLADKTTGGWIVVPVMLAGVLGGMVWAGITALLKDRFNGFPTLGRHHCFNSFRNRSIDFATPLSGKMLNSVSACSRKPGVLSPARRASWMLDACRYFTK